MSELNLDFDAGTKSISLSNVLNDNLDINKENDTSFFNDTSSAPTFSEPNLKVSSDLSGVELLAKGISNDTIPDESKNSGG